MLLTACSAARPGSMTRNPRTIVEVDNRGFSDMTVYVINSGQRVRLGMATGNSKTKLTIPYQIVSGTRQLQFLADPIGSNRTSVSQEITVRPGDVVSLVIMP